MPPQRKRSEHRQPHSSNWSSSFSGKSCATSKSKLPRLRSLSQEYKPWCINAFATIRRKFRSETSDSMDSWKAEVRRIRRERVRGQKIQMREKVGKSRNTVFPMICGSGGSKSRLAKAAGAEPAGQMRDEKLHAVVARSTFPSQNVKNTRGLDHFWRFRSASLRFA